MRICYIALCFPKIKNSEYKNLVNTFRYDNAATKYLCEIEAYFEKYKDDGYSYQHLTAYQNYLDTYMDSYQDTYAEFCTMLGRMSQIFRKAEETAGELSEGMSAEEIKNFWNLYWQSVKALRQQYWVSWLEDFYCEKIERAIQAVEFSEEEKNDNWLFIAALPEFIFTDDEELMFSKGGKDRVLEYAAAEGFIRDTLPKDNPRTKNGIRTFFDLSSAMENKLLILPGTILFRETVTLNDKSQIIDTNLAPVFYEGRLAYAWEKQTVSGVDPVKEKERRDVFFFGTKDSEQIDEFYAGTLSGQILRNLNPIFFVKTDDEILYFALSICKDFYFDTILGKNIIDIHILLASDIRPKNMLKNIVGEKLFLYCDKVGFVGAFEKGSYEDENTFAEALREKVNDNSRYTEPGMYTEKTRDLSEL